MRYALLIHGDEQAWEAASAQERRDAYARHGAFPRMLEEGADWEAVAALYARLEALTPSPVVRLNRALALAENAVVRAHPAERRAAAAR